MEVVVMIVLDDFVGIVIKEAFLDGIEITVGVMVVVVGIEIIVGVVVLDGI